MPRTYAQTVVNARRLALQRGQAARTVESTHHPSIDASGCSIPNRAGCVRAARCVAPVRHIDALAPHIHTAYFAWNRDFEIVCYPTPPPDIRATSAPARARRSPSTTPTKSGASPTAAFNSSEQPAKSLYAERFPGHATA
jgi:hypothetical protein